jgi:protein-tyrosine phosphatase
MKIHIVCTGNSFRSRMAEAYLKSKDIPGLEVSSSGIKAADNENGPISWFAMRQIKNHALIPFMSRDWRQTTRENIAESDLVILMEQTHYNFCQSLLSPDQKYQIWGVQDIADCSEAQDLDNLLISDRIFELIQKQVDSLVASL